MINLAVVGAFDRDNYGDILMPIVFTEYLKKYHQDFYKKLNIDYFSLTNKDMSNVLGINSKSISDIPEQFNNIIIIGGDVLPCRYGNMFLNLQNLNDKKLKLYKFSDLFLRPFFDSYTKSKLNMSNVRPWIFANDKNVFYNTVGGALRNRNLLFQRNKIISNLQNASYLSVRDDNTNFYLNKNNISSSVYPDSVMMVSCVLDDKKIEEYINPKIKDNINKLGEYIVIQMNKKVGKNIIDDVTKEIEKIYEKYQIPTVLLPIGKAEGHEDQVPLEIIKNKVKTPCYLVSNNNIYDTIYIIKRSIFYCGTSLHGAITATSYDVPSSALTNKIEKLNSFYNTWDVSSIKVTEAFNISNTLDYVLNDKIESKKLNKKRLELIDKVRINNESIIKKLEELNYEK